MYVDNLRNKKLDTRDIKLLNITGLKEVIEILGAREEFNYKLKLGAKYDRGSIDMNMDMVNKGVNFNDLTDIMDDSMFNKKKGNLTDTSRDKDKQDKISKRKSKITYAKAKKGVESYEKTL